MCYMLCSRIIIIFILLHFLWHFHFLYELTCNQAFPSVSVFPELLFLVIFPYSSFLLCDFSSSSCVVTVLSLIFLLGIFLKTCPYNLILIAVNVSSKTFILKSPLTVLTSCSVFSDFPFWISLESLSLLHLGYQVQGNIYFIKKPNIVT